MATMTIRIAKHNTKIFNNQTNKMDTSYTGHMWYEVNSKSTGFFSAGFVPIKRESDGPGKVEREDYKNYAEAYYTATIDISEDQAKKLQDFAKNPDSPAYKFSKHYNGLNHSCVDFVYKALNVIGLNKGYDNWIFNRQQGDMLPYNNVDNIHKLLGSKIKETLSKSVLHKDIDFRNPQNAAWVFKALTGQQTIKKGKFNTILNPNLLAKPRSAASYEVHSLNNENTAELLTVSANHNSAPNEFAKLIGQANNMMNAISAFGSDGAVASFANNDPYSANMPQLAVAA